ncbi:hypothetical protein ACXZ1K_12655 [Pedobacter sp. PWIIR3]
MKIEVSALGEEKKYKLEESLNQLTYHEYRFARSVLPKIIGKCNNTLNNYANILLDSKEEIPYTIGIKLERFFGIEPGEFSNVKIDNVHYKELFNEWIKKKD